MRWLFLALMLGGCGTKACKDQTVLVSLTLSGGTAQADTFDVTVVVGGSQMLTAKGLSHDGSSANGTVEIQFPKGYPSKQSIDVTVDARLKGALIGSGHNGTTLDAGCVNLSITVGAIDDLGMTMDLSAEDFSVEDLAVNADLSASPSPTPSPNPCALQPGAAAYVDNGSGGATEFGTDDPAHGGAPGKCAFKTITYALQHATGSVNVAAGIYDSVATHVGRVETFPMVLTGSQKLICTEAPDPGGTHLEGVGPWASLSAGEQATIVLSGIDGEVAGCLLANPSVAMTIGIFAEFPNGGAKIFRNSFANYASAIRWNATGASTLSLNTFAGSSQTDIACVTSSSDLSGGGNTSNFPEAGSGPGCISCANCASFGDSCGTTTNCCPGDVCGAGSCCDTTNHQCGPSCTNVAHPVCVLGTCQ